ncbi:MAG: polysaccharide lyase family 7 protein, partial [Myxococcota bacterium]
ALAPAWATSDTAAPSVSPEVQPSQVVELEPNRNYQLQAFVRGPGNVGVKVGRELFFEQQPRVSKDWRKVQVSFPSGAFDQVTVFCSSPAGEVRFDDFALFVLGEGEFKRSARVLGSAAGGYGLSPDLPPGRNFDLLGWYVSLPTDRDNNGKADSIYEAELVKGFEKRPYFYTGEDGGMVFWVTNSGARTSKNTKFTRTELREMLRRGNKEISTKNEDGTPNKNGWVFSSAPLSAQQRSGGVDGVLRATLAVNRVTTTGDPSHVGRVIVGQIHAKDDEPARLYYRKLPGHTKGSLYLAHEPLEREDLYFDLVGSRADDAPDPADGIALDEKFSYEIRVRGNTLTVRIFQGEDTKGEVTVDMSDSGYDVANDYMYFKAGVYNQNNTGDDDDYTQATFYELETHHEPPPSP